MGTSCAVAPPSASNVRFTTPAPGSSSSAMVPLARFWTAPAAMNSLAVLYTCARQGTACARHASEGCGRRQSGNSRRAKAAGAAARAAVPSGGQG